MLNRFCLLTLALSLALAACEETASTSQGSAAKDHAADSQTALSQAAAQVLTDLQGNQRRISDWRGKVVLVNFWATWCTPCLREIPALREARRKYGERGFEVLGIAIDEKQAVLRFVAEQQIEYPILEAENGGLELLTSLGNERGGLPFSVVLDRQGMIRLRHLGELTPAQIEEEIEKLL
jgi:peroxiredoxin